MIYYFKSAAKLINFISVKVLIKIILLTLFYSYFHVFKHSKLSWLYLYMQFMDSLKKQITRIKGLFLLCTVFILLCPEISMAQEGKPERFLNFGPGYAHITSKDLGMSPLKYKGSAFFFQMGFHKFSEKTHHYLDLNFQIGLMRPKNKSSNVIRYYAAIDYALHKPFLSSKWDKYRYFIGGSLLTMTAVREHQSYGNNAYNYDVMSGLGISGSVQRTIALKNRNIILKYQLDLPVVAVGSRPGYASPQPEGFYEEPGEIFKSAMRSIEFWAWNRFFRIKNQFSVVYYLSNTNTLQLIYSWDYYSIRSIEANKVQTATHGIQLLTKFRF